MFSSFLSEEEEGRVTCFKISWARSLAVGPEEGEVMHLPVDAR